jgi:hypothetical protein
MHPFAVFLLIAVCAADPCVDIYYAGGNPLKGASCCMSNVLETMGTETRHVANLQHYAEAASASFVCVEVSGESSLLPLAALLARTAEFVIVRRASSAPSCVRAVDSSTLEALTYVGPLLSGSGFYRCGQPRYDVITFAWSQYSLFVKNTLHALKWSTLLVFPARKIYAEDLFTPLINSRVFIIPEWYHGAEAHIALALSNGVRVVAAACPGCEDRYADHAHCFLNRMQPIYWVHEGESFVGRVHELLHVNQGPLEYDPESGCETLFLSRIDQVRESLLRDI